jgi:hypothetical protein
MANQAQWHVTIKQVAQYGTIHYFEVDQSAEIKFSWEFGGGSVIVMIFSPPEVSWDKNYPWAAGRRQQIIERVAQETVRQRAPRNRYEIESDGMINIR